ncbi:MAG: ABC transporter permease [Cellulosilyticaceae bacterium]
MNKKVLATPYLLWTAIFVIIPLVLIVYFSFTVQTPEGVQFSLDSYKRFFDPLYTEVLLRSLQLALTTTVISLIFAYPLAMILNGKEFSNKGIVLLLVILPMWMNSLLRTYAWLPILGNNGIINNLLQSIGIPPQQFLYGNGAIVFGMLYNFFPFMVLPIYNALNKIDRSLIEASQDLGADQVTTFKKVILPLSLPGVVTGVIMVFMPSLTTFVITRLMGGGRVTLIGNVIEEQFTRTRDWAFGSALSMILMIIILISIGFMSKNDTIGKGGGLI